MFKGKFSCHRGEKPPQPLPPTTSTPTATSPAASSACASSKRRCLDSLPEECLEASLLALAERLYVRDGSDGSDGSDGLESMANGLLSLLRAQFQQRDGGSDAGFQQVLMAYKKQQQEIIQWERLPSEALAVVIRHLWHHPARLGNMAMVCRAWYLEVNRKTVWHQVCRATLGCTSEQASLTTKLVELLGQNDYRPSLLAVAPLVKAGADLTVRHGAATPFLLAVFHGHLHVAQFLLLNKANPYDKTTCGKSALHIAAMRNHQELVAWLATIGFGLRDRDECGNSSVLVAALGGAKTVLTYLRTMGVSFSDHNDEGMTALHLAALAGHPEIIQQLLGSGSYELPVDHGNIHGQTALHCAALYGRIDCVRALIRHGANPAARDKSGANTVMLAALGCMCSLNPAPNPASLQNHGNLIERLILQHANVISANDRDLYGRTAVHYARVNRHYPLVDLLIRLGADPNMPDDFRATPADYETLVRSLRNKQEARVKEVLERVTGLAITLSPGARNPIQLGDAELRILCRCLSTNHSVQTLVILNSNISVQRNIEALLHLFGENRTLCQLDFGEQPRCKLPLVLQEYLLYNNTLRKNGGKCLAEAQAVAQQIAGRAAAANGGGAIPMTVVAAAAEPGAMANPTIRIVTQQQLVQQQQQQPQHLRPRPVGAQAAPPQQPQPQEAQLPLAQQMQVQQAQAHAADAFAALALGLRRLQSGELVPMDNADG